MISTREYQTITRVASTPDSLTVGFANGDQVAISCSVLVSLTSYFSDIRWAEAKVDEGFIRIPAKPQPMELYWSTIRQLTDEHFREQMVRASTEQARHVGSRIQEFRLRQGLDVRCLAQYSGLDQTVIIRIEAGVIDDWQTVMRILSALGRSFGDLAG